QTHLRRAREGHRSASAERGVQDLASASGLVSRRNPIVGYSKLKDCIRLLFWSGQSFDEPGLAVEGTFKAAEARYTSEDQISAKDLKRGLAKSIEIQWDYKNIVKRKGKLERLK